MEVLGSLLGQGLYGRLSTSRSNHMLVASWLVFGVVVSTGYRGSLIASLTLPRQPPRPETVEELVTAVERATIEPYGISYKGFFTESDNLVYQDLGRLMHVGIYITEGLTDALTLKRAHVGGRQYLELSVAKYFTRIDGTSPIYIGSDNIIPSTSAWPIPHDAPYKPVLDKTIMSITEAGLYEQWRKLHLEDAGRISRVKQRDELSRNKQDIQPDDGQSKPTRSLTITHVQGPLLLLVLGLAIGSVVLIAEITIVTKYSDMK
ncbi:hypothetical protein Pmani_004050 [Petrolisthes manimaculis]|uniref:Ionotropic glutamate receptor C-terminal domain-containing protein n=1 Tax=Petrolisthes manimaculis TaxID=1843537 RepID=A0AAE1ULX2_9EUCA|nr:hypothetical protein Pmani_004050 [Petrolisthes manimaculis]